VREEILYPIINFEGFLPTRPLNSSLQFANRDCRNIQLIVAGASEQHTASGRVTFLHEPVCLLLRSSNWNPFRKAEKRKNAANSNVFECFAKLPKLRTCVRFPSLSGCPAWRVIDCRNHPKYKVGDRVVVKLSGGRTVEATTILWSSTGLKNYGQCGSTFTIRVRLS
jgi:hypothetical protein